MFELTVFNPFDRVVVARGQDALSWALTRSQSSSLTIPSSEMNSWTRITPYRSEWSSETPFIPLWTYHLDAVQREEDEYEVLDDIVVV